MAGSDVERYVTAGDLASRSDQELARVGFSPAFPEQLQLLNEGFSVLLASKGTGFQSYRFTLHPDDDDPSVDVEACYKFPYRVQIEAYIGKFARFDVDTKSVKDSHPLTQYTDSPRVVGGLGKFTFKELHNFTDIYPTDEPIKLTATLGTKKEEDRRELPESVTVDFKKIRAAQHLYDLGLVPGRYGFRLWFDTPSIELAMRLNWAHGSDEAFMYLADFHAIDTSANIETIIGNLGRLLARTGEES